MRKKSGVLCNFALDYSITCGPRKNNMRHASRDFEKSIVSKKDDGNIFPAHHGKFDHQLFSIKNTDVADLMQHVEIFEFSKMANFAGWTKIIKNSNIFCHVACYFFLDRFKIA